MNVVFEEFLPLAWNEDQGWWVGYGMSGER